MTETQDARLHLQYIPFSSRPTSRSRFARIAQFRARWARRAHGHWGSHDKPCLSDTFYPNRKVDHRAPGAAWPGARTTRGDPSRVPLNLAPILGVKLTWVMGPVNDDGHPQAPVRRLLRLRQRQARQASIHQLSMRRAAIRSAKPPDQQRRPHWSATMRTTKICCPLLTPPTTPRRQKPSRRIRGSRAQLKLCRVPRTPPDSPRPIGVPGGA